MNIEFNSQQLMENMTELFVTYGIKILLAIVVYYLGQKLASWISGFCFRTLELKNVDPTISKFTRNIVYYCLFTMVIIASLGQLGIQTASFVAVIGAAGLAIGFALQGSLANFASGVLLILFRPIRIGDYVEVAGASGSVREISIFSTVLLTPDNKTVIVSNSGVMGNTITNYSVEATRRVDLVVGVSYDTDLSVVRSELETIASEDNRILVDKGWTIAVSELADSSVNFVFRVWVNTPDYWDVYFSLNEKIKVNFDKKGIQIPFPQMDVHVNQQAA